MRVCETCGLPMDGSHTTSADCIHALRLTLSRAAFVADHMFQMIDRETWRAYGGDDGQGHYEGDYRAVKVQEEIDQWKKVGI